MGALKAKNYKEMSLLFCGFVIPALTSQLLSGVYTIVDGFFVGMGAGDAGLAAVGIAYPFTVFATAAGAGIGIGGGALISMSRGRGRGKQAEDILTSMVMLMVLASLLISISFSAALPKLIGLFKISEELSRLSSVYGLILLIFSFTQIFTMGLLGAVRNDGYPRKAMYIMVSGFVLNIILDWLWVLVYPFGVAGAAWATVVSQMLTASLLFCHFLRGHSNVRLRFKKTPKCLLFSRRIMTMGISPFGVQMAAALTMIMHNWQSLVYGGEAGIAAYSVISYVIPVGVMLQEGIAEGIQPLVSYYYGASLPARRKFTAKMGFSSAFGVGIACSLLLLVSARFIPGFFSMSGTASAITARGLILASPMFPFVGINKVGASYYQSIGRSGHSSFLTYVDPLLVLPMFLWCLPLLWKLDGVWLSMTFANIALSVILIVIWIAESRGVFFARVADKKI
ncbi:MAG: MATE family efflux transporter [Synergistaceae bacterium]|nr:MATE family efflux transporter [Synergistaceae bacterium]